jgi:hypothetical protein
MARGFGFKYGYEMGLHDITRPPSEYKYAKINTPTLSSYLLGVDLQKIGYTDMETCLSGGHVPVGPDICDNQDDVDPFREEEKDEIDENISNMRISKCYPRRAYGIPAFTYTEILNVQTTDKMTPDFIRNKIEQFFDENEIEITDNNYSFPIGPRADWDHYRVEKRPNYWYAWNVILKKDDDDAGEDVKIHMRLYLSNPIIDDTPATMLLTCNNVKGRNDTYFAMTKAVGDWILDKVDSTDIIVHERVDRCFEVEEEIYMASNRMDGGLFVLITYCFVIYFMIVYQMHVGVRV